MLLRRDSFQPEPASCSTPVNALLHRLTPPQVITFHVGLGPYLHKWKQRIYPYHQFSGTNSCMCPKGSKLVLGSQKRCQCWEPTTLLIITRQISRPYTSTIRRKARSSSIAGANCPPQANSKQPFPIPCTELTTALPCCSESIRGKFRCSADAFCPCSCCHDVNGSLHRLLAPAHPVIKSFISLLLIS